MLEKRHVATSPQPRNLLASYSTHLFPFIATTTSNNIRLHDTFYGEDLQPFYSQLSSQCPAGGSRGRERRKYYRLSWYLSKTNTTPSRRHNQARASLMDLPGEVLNIIYALVVGGDTIHVLVKESNKVETRHCHAKEADPHAVSTICNATERTKIVSYSRRHASCRPRRVYAFEDPC